jgi:thioesterase domain-containing protein
MLGPEQPIWALQARGLVKGEKPHDSIFEMASEYIAAIKQVQKKGPYHLLGMSLGGVIAQEMARILESQGEEIGLLALLDSSAKEGSEQINDLTDSERTNNLLISIAHDLDIDPNKASLSNSEFITAARDGLIKVGAIPPQTPVSWLLKLLENSLFSSKLIANHKKRRCNSPILYFLASQDRAVEDLSGSEWNEFSNGGVFTYVVDARHSNLLWQPKSLLQIRAGLKDYLDKKSVG